MLNQVAFIQRPALSALLCPELTCEGTPFSGQGSTREAVKDALNSYNGIPGFEDNASAFALEFRLGVSLHVSFHDFSLTCKSRCIFMLITDACLNC
jgi:hypothetical protein